MLETLVRAPESPADLALIPTLEEFDLITGALSEKQITSIVDSLSDECKIAVWVGAVSAGKTFASLLALFEAIRTAPKGETLVIIGKTLQTIERNVITQLQKPTLMGELATATVHTTGSNHAVILGRRVELIGAYNAGAEERIRGGTFYLAYVDEATLIPEEFWNMLVTRLRVEGARLLATTNPASKNHWLRKKWILSTDKGVRHFHLTMDDNPGLPAWYVTQMKASFSGLFYDRFILGIWTNAEGAIYEMWDPARHVIRWLEMPTLQDILCIGIDHGTTNPTSAIMLGITDEHDARGKPTPRLVLMDEWRYAPNSDPESGPVLPRLTNVEQSKRIRTWMRQAHYPGPEMLPAPRFVFVDPAAADFREQMRADKVTTHPADNAVAEGIADVGSLLGQGRLIVAEPAGPNTPGCAGWLEEVTEYSWDPKVQARGEDAPLKEHDHSMDAGRYAVRSSRSWWQPILQRAYGLAA